MVILFIVRRRYKVFYYMDSQDGAYPVGPFVFDFLMDDKLQGLLGNELFYVII